jgi:putative transposase
VNRKRVSRLMRLMGPDAIYPKPRLSANGPDRTGYPYLLKGTKVQAADEA